ncbi:hypothetical protein RvY_03463 [Ramazzottius varieornatus]|uniref:Peptidase C1A papain C-terminal domain-containing protein n=1 Tax=Ramazzottius varieornatus TaxID=947166 RepID=A0A1D1URI1_RAMVA|nr:hypothetical protein RvY_03463 [Ramazzottius varieornatus]
MAKFLVPLALVLAVLAAVGSAKKGFKAPPNGAKPLSDKEIDSHPKQKPGGKTHRAVVPVAFDARKVWPNCKSISTIRDQGQCGTCWAVSAASVLSDRLCIASGQTINVMISASQTAGCSVAGQSPDANCQAGGDASSAYKYAAINGLPTGGAYGSNQGCVPYNVPSDKAVPQTCATKCTNPTYTTPLPQDLKLVDSYWINYQKGGKQAQMTQVQIDAVVSQIQQDIMANGPLTATMEVYDDFQDWDATQGVYTGPKAGAADLGGHAIVIIGWDRTPAGVPYWLIRNSWSDQAGEKGIFWLALGKNTVGIETTISAPIVKMPNPCLTSSFCDQPIDQAMSIDAKNPTAPIFLFQGNCSLQVTVKPDGKMTPVSPAAPIGKSIIGAPPGPITSYMINADKLWMINPAGEAASGCSVPTGATKVLCTARGTASGGSSAQSTFYKSGVMNKWSYVPQYTSWLFDQTNKGTNANTLLTDNFASVNALQNVDGTKMVVFGKDKAGKAAAGVLTYPTSATSGFTWATKPGPTSALLSCATAAPGRR